MKMKLPDFVEAKKNDPEFNWGNFSWLEEHVDSNVKVPAGFVMVAEDGTGGGLAVAEKADNILYRVEEGEIDVYALSEEELKGALRRDEAWEELAENMPASHPYWLGVMLKTKQEDGKMLTLGFPGMQRQSAMIMRARVEADDMLTDALDRELEAGLEISDYTVVDIIDDGGVVMERGVEEPLFTVVVEVEAFDPQEKIGDPAVGWMSMEEKKKVEN